MISIKRALNALKVLTEYGRQSFEADAKVGFGATVGMALSKCDMRAEQILDAAGAALEDQNHHLAAHIVWALKTPSNVRHEGNTVVITLPDYLKDYNL